MVDKTKKKKVIFAFSVILLIFLLTLSACSKKTDQNTKPENKIVPIEIPSDIPVYPGAKQISNEQGKDFTRAVFSVDASVDEIKAFYSKQMPGKWAVPKEWFKVGNTEQRYHTTDDYDETAKTGRSMIIVVAPDNKDPEKSVLSLVITDFNKYTEERK